MSDADDIEHIITGKDDEIHHLRELNAELLEVVEGVCKYYYCMPRVVIDKAEAVLAKANERGTT